MLIRRALLKSGVVVLGGVALAGRSTSPQAQERLKNRIPVPGTLRLTAQTRKNGKARRTTVDWQVADTGVIICDMWSADPCQLAAARVAAMAPRMNQVVMAARDHGAMIFHAPSDMYDEYDRTPYRKRIQQATYYKPAEEMIRRPPEPEKEGALPIPGHDSPTEGCDDAIPPPKLAGPPWPRRKQIASIIMTGHDGVSESGQEIYNFCQQEGIKNLAIMGIHTNFCITNRSFGIRQMVRIGMNVVLVRDLTDALYDPRDPPHVSHTRGTELMIEHIEEHWCPSILAEDLTRVVPGSASPPGSGAAKSGTRRG